MMITKMCMPIKHLRQLEKSNLNNPKVQAPGKKDFVIKRQSGKKDYRQKRHMMFSLKEAHSVSKGTPSG